MEVMVVTARTLKTVSVFFDSCKIYNKQKCAVFIVQTGVYDNLVYPDTIVQQC